MNKKYMLTESQALSPLLSHLILNNCGPQLLSAGEKAAA